MKQNSTLKNVCVLEKNYESLLHVRWTAPMVLVEIVFSFFFRFSHKDYPKRKLKNEWCFLPNR